MAAAKDLSQDVMPDAMFKDEVELEDSELAEAFAKMFAGKV